MLHGARQTPDVWRAVSDSFPSEWAVVAPQLHGRKNLDAMNAASVHDLGQVLMQPPIVVVATGTGAVPAIEFCARNLGSGDIAGLLLAEPQIAVTPAAVHAARLAAAVHKDRSAPRSADGKFTNARYTQRASYLQALQGESMAQRAEELAAASLPVWILAAQKDRQGMAGAREAQKVMPQAKFFEIAQAQADWNAYAPRNFAANVLEFVHSIGAEHRA